MIFVMGLTPGGIAFAGSSQEPSGITLYDALAEAYQKNPDLEAVRAELRAVDELYPQARVGFMPGLAGVADYTATNSDASHTAPKTLGLQLTQSLYSGGSTVANVDQSKNKIKAERAKLKVTEEQVLLDGVTAYMNLIRDQEIVELNLNNERVLIEHLDASRERFKLGDITKTDVSLSESGLAKATASRIAAEGQLQNSRAFFEKVIDLRPAGLQKPELTPALPATEDDALALAESNNPSIMLAGYSEDAARATTRSIEGEDLPKVDLTGALDRVYDPAVASSGDGNSGTIKLTATFPLYTGGGTTSRIRQARQTERQLHMQMSSAERTVHQAVVEAWEGLAAAEAESRALQTQIEAARMARDGIKVEVEFGARTTLDLLDAEQAYLDAEVARVGAETTRVIAAYTLMSAVGSLTAEGLHLRVPIYNPALAAAPAANYQNNQTNPLSE